MCRLLETIRVENGIPENLEAHQHRMDVAGRFFFGDHFGISLIDEISPLIASQKKTTSIVGLFKLRIVYAETIIQTTFIKYELPTIDSLQLVYNDDIEYAFKLADRRDINRLTDLKKACDEIIIVKNGLITDSSYANLAFYDGNCWKTPAKPLLAGTRRSVLLKNQTLIEAEIRPEDLVRFQKVRLFNAMIRWQDQLEVDIRNIHL